MKISERFLHRYALAVTFTLASLPTMAEDDWEKRAAEAAARDESYLPTGGKPIPAAAPKTNAVPSPTSTEQTPTTNASAATIKNLNAQRQTARADYQKQIKNLQDSEARNSKLYKAAKQRKADAQAALKAKNVNKSVIERLWDDDETDQLQAEIGASESAMKTYSSKLNALRPALSNKIAESVRYEDAIQLQIVKADPVTAKAESQRRSTAAQEVVTRYETQKAQLEIGTTKFNETIKIMDKLIAKAEESGQSGIAEALANDKQQISDSHTQWASAQESTIKTFRRDMDRTYQENRDADIGPTSRGDVIIDIRRRARTEGKDQDAAVDFIDDQAVVATANSASKVARAAPNNTQHENNVGTFVADYYETNINTLLTDPSKFVTRYAAYGKGSARAVKDGVVDLFVLAVELGDTALEVTEVALNHYGVEVNVAGRENLQAVYTGSQAVGALIDPDDPEGGKVALKITGMANQAGRAMDRYVERQASKGEKGVENMLDKTGYVTTTALGGEEAALKVVGKVFKLATKTGKTSKAAGQIDEVADAGSAGAAASRAPEGTSAPSTAARTGNRADDWLSDTIDPELRAIAVRESHMVPEHLEAFSKVAQRDGTILLFRPVNPHATALIKGDAATKGMNIKGKSSDWGPQAGMIPIDPIYSKMGTPDGSLATGVTPKKIREYHELNKKALGQDWYKYKDGKWVKQKPKKAIAQELEVEGPDGKKIKVLADFSDPPRPITADYDLFAVSSKRGSGGMVDNPEQMAEMGNIGRNEVETMNRLNDAAKNAGYKGGNVVHHGAANRFANELEAADFPIPALLPNGDVKLIYSPSDLRKLYEKYANRGYKMDHMPGWNFNEVTDAGKAAREAKALAKRKAREAKEAKEAAEAARAPTVTPGSNLGPVLAGKAIRTGEDDGSDEPAEQNSTRPTTGGSSNEDDATSEEDDETLVSIGGGFGELISPVDPIYFSFGPGGWLAEEESWISLPLEENYVSLGNGASFTLEGARSLGGTNVHSGSGLIGGTTTPPTAPPQTSLPPQPPATKPPTKPPSKPAPKPPAYTTPAPPVSVTPPPQVSPPAKPPVSKKPEARISTSTGGTTHRASYSFACFSIRFAGDIDPGDKVEVYVSGPGDNESYDLSISAGYDIGIRHKIYSYGSYDYRVNSITTSGNESVNLLGNMSGSYTVDSRENAAACQ